MRVFLSSTGKDLADYRAAAIDICNRLRLVPLAMEFFEAMGAGATAGSLTKLADADVYVGIFAHRYGYIENGYARSVTEEEFDAADQCGIERLCFLVDPKHPWSPEAWDPEHHGRLQQFKMRVEQSTIRAVFTSVDDFRVKLQEALVQWQVRQSNRAAIREKHDTSNGSGYGRGVNVTARQHKTKLKNLNKWYNEGLVPEENFKEAVQKILDDFIAN